MLLSFPHMGKLHLALEETFQLLELPYILPSLPGPLAVELGKELAPEGSCFPFVLVLGNMREALDKGADTLVMLGGSGPCRFGFFVYLAERILRDAGYDFRLLIIDKGHNLETLRVLLSKQKINVGAAISAVRKGWQRVVCEEGLAGLEREFLPQAFEAELMRNAIRNWRTEMEGASTVAQLVKIRNRAEDYVRAMPLLPTEKILKVGLVGDIYTLLEPYANQHIEDYLSRQQVSVVKEMALSSWIPNTLLPWRKDPYKRELLKHAYPYLQDSVGGFGLESVANSVRYSLDDVDGIIQLFPLGCMPEIVAHSVLSRLSSREGIPIMSISMDEHDSMTGFATRLEAFLDMLWRRKKRTVDKWSCL